MKKLMLSTAFLAATSFSAMAQDGGATFRTTADPMEIYASDFIGMRVYASEAAIDSDAYNGIQDGWEDIGEINDVILNRDGKVDAVLVDVGGFLGMGERQVAVDMTSIRFVADDATAEDLSDYFLVTNASRVLVEAAPEYQSGRTTTTTPMDTTTTTREPMMRDGYAAAMPADMTTEMLTGASVYDVNDELVGEVSQINIDGSGNITEAVVDVGGFLGMGEKPVALQMSELDILREDGGDDLRVYVAMTKEQMEAAPAYKE